MSDTSDSRSDTMDDCMAAMVLMRLSVSPKSPRISGSDSVASSLSSHVPSSAASSASSASSSGCSSFDPHSLLLAAPSAASSLSSATGGFFDLGLVRMSESRKTEYRCTLCGVQFVACDTVLRHIRFAHLDQNEAMSNDNEEQYYIKVEVEVEGSDPGGFDGPEGGEAGEPEELATSFEDDMSLSGESTDDASSRPSSPPSPVASQQPSQPPHNSIFMSSAPTLSHLDMARPPHEDPELQRKEFSSSPINIPPFRHTQQKKLQTKIHLSPKHRSRGRSESRKCRKVYGMENRDQWCTQCKWKKACTRFAD